MRFSLVLPDVDYGSDAFKFPFLSNTYMVMPDKFNRYSSNPAAPFHCFVDDWRIEAIWRHPQKIVDRVIMSRFAVAPDYTVEVNHPLPHAFYQVWRSRVVAAWWAAHGVYVVPCLQWSRPEINGFLFQGLADCEVVAVRSPTRGFEKEWEACALQFLAVCRPRLVLHFGTSRGFDVWPDARRMTLR